MMASAMAGACSSSIVSQSNRAPSSIPTISLPFTSKLRNNNTNNYNSKQYSIINNPHHRLFQSKLPPSSTPVSAAQAQQTINPTTSTPTWSEFASKISGEWDGFGADFTTEGKPIELPEYVVPEAYREWEVKVFDWQTQCPTLAHPQDLLLTYKTIKLLPTAFIAAWKEACRATGKVKLLVPKGVYLIGPVKFAGPCKNVSSLTVYMKGYLKATAKLSRYGSGTGWVEFGWLERLTLTGGGTFDGQGAKAWPYNNCTTDSKCKLLPTNVKFVAMNQTVVQGITSLNSKFFHIALVECKNFKGTEIKISAPADSPNTDGIHVERSSNVFISRSLIGTGDDCISIGQGNSQVTITRIRCGPGHGIRVNVPWSNSVGSLGRYENEGDVSGLVVRDCAISGTMNGIRIKTWANSPGSSAATNMTFENIVMKNVTNPIIIDQSYCPFSSCISTEPSKVKLSDIYFKQIRGTSSSAVAVALECSEGIPCQNIFLENVHLELSTGEKQATSSCKNVRARYIGEQIPPPCA